MEAGDRSQESADADLVQRAKERSPSAWAAIYDAHYPKLYRYCYARTSDQATAADLASKVFLEALEGIGRYVYRGRPLLAWLYRIARNVTSDHLRARKRESEALQRAAGVSEPHDPGPAARVGDQRDVLVALHQLTDDQQQVITLRYYAGFSTAEIAHAMERSERAVYSLEVRALAALRRLLAPGRVAEPDERQTDPRNSSMPPGKL
jgi:RNA polymerase sigma-70 factor (ECF subfamily)